MSEWISVDDRLPCEDEDYLLWLEIDGYSAFSLGYHDDDKWLSISDEPLIDVTHWMPLPKPPKGLK